MEYKIIKIDPYLTPYKDAIKHRMDSYCDKRSELLKNDNSLADFANGYEYFGIHKTSDGWVYREWAPAAEALFFTGDFNGWDIYSCPMKRLENGIFEIEILGADSLKIGQKIQTVVIRNGEIMRRIPTYATRVVQDPQNYSWCAEVDDTLFDNFKWSDSGFKPTSSPIIYECHIGMAGEDGMVNSFNQFTENVLPRI